MAAARRLVPYPATFRAAANAEAEQDQADNRGRPLHARTITDLWGSDEQCPNHA
jgi:hypothetical protein